MAKRIKLLLYGDPGTGKSVFASKAPKPFFITTDGNYEWLEDFGAKPEDHIQVSSWEAAKKAFEKSYDGYETIVVDLLEDMFKWCEFEFCLRSKIDHVSDIGYGKGYDISRNEFFLEICKLLAKDKHIILITHGITFVTKDRRGVEHTKYAPSSRIPDKVLDMIEGRVRYCLRCYAKAEEQNDGTVLKKRYLSLVPKENEFGIARGIDEAITPHDIPLDFAEFAAAIKLDVNAPCENTSAAIPMQMPVEEEKPRRRRRNQETEAAPAEKPTSEQVEETLTPIPTPTQPVSDNTAEAKPAESTIVATEPAPTQSVAEQPKPVEQPKPAQSMSNADKIAAIKAKLAGRK